ILHDERARACRFRRRPCRRRALRSEKEQAAFGRDSGGWLPATRVPLWRHSDVRRECSRQRVDTVVAYCCGSARGGGTHSVCPEKSFAGRRVVKVQKGL